MDIIGSTPAKDYVEWAKQSGSPGVIHKEVKPISDLFTKFFMGDMDVDYSKIKPWLEDKLSKYCKIYADAKIHRCTHVTNRYICPSDIASCKSKLPCGYYTGPIDINFLPHGMGSFIESNSTNMDGNDASIYEWKQGCAGDVSRKALYDIKHNLSQNYMYNA